MPSHAQPSVERMRLALTPAGGALCLRGWTRVVRRCYSQDFCSECGLRIERNSGDNHHLCHTCSYKRLHSPSAAAEAPAASAPSSPLSLFGRPTGCIDQLTTVERAAIVTLHGIGWTGRRIAEELHCDEHAVTRWVHRWQETHSLEDADRSGRPRCTDDDTDIAIEEWADEKKRTVPKEIKKELQLGCAARTVRRRLDEVGLYGRWVGQSMCLMSATSSDASPSLRATRNGRWPTGVE